MQFVVIILLVCILYLLLCHAMCRFVISLLDLCSYFSVCVCFIFSCFHFCRKSIEYTDLSRATDAPGETNRSVPKTASKVAGTEYDTNKNENIDDDAGLAVENKRIKSTTTASTQTPSRQTSSFFTSKFMFSTY